MTNDLPGVLTDAAADALLIAPPPLSPARPALDAMAAAKDVSCEKPWR